MSVFEEMRKGKSYDIRDETYQKEVHGEIARCDHLCWEIRQTDPADIGKVSSLEKKIEPLKQSVGGAVDNYATFDCSHIIFSSFIVILKRSLSSFFSLSIKTNRFR